MNDTGQDIDERYESALSEAVSIADDPLWVRPHAIGTRVASIAFGAIMPIVLLLMSGNTIATMDRPWQSGQPSMYVSMLMKPSAHVWFFPWIAFSMGGLLTWLWSPRNARNHWVQLGLLTGVVVSIQYLILILIAQGPLSPIAATALVVAFYGTKWTISFLFRYYRRFQIWHIFVVMTFVAVLAAITQLDQVLKMIFGFLCLVPFLMIAATPTLNVLVYTCAAYSALRVVYRDATRNHSLLMWASLPWLFGWLASWRMAVQAMLDEYSRLPTTNPNCYFANASAAASSWLARRETPRIGMSEPAITISMQRLKFLEIVLMVTCPATHKMVRMGYDLFGQPAAACCQKHLWLANATVIAILPLELAAEAIRLSAGISPKGIRQIYR